jgi:hypothetical protein
MDASFAMQNHAESTLSLKTTVCLLFVLCLLTAVLTTVYFKPADLVSNTPIYTDDYSMHYAKCISTKKFLLDFRKTWAYEPFFLAGYPRGVFVNADNKAWELFYFVLSPLIGEGRAFKLYVVLFLLFYPLCLYGAARNFNISREAAIMAALLGVVFFQVSLPKDLVQWGMVSYVMVCYCSIYVFSLFFGLYDRFSWTRYAATALAGSLLLLMHILSFMHLVIPLVVLYLCSIKKLTRLQHVAVVCLPLIMLGLNSSWLLPIFQLLHYKTDRPENYEFAMQIKNTLELFSVYLDQKRTAAHTLPIFNNTLIDVLLMLFGLSTLYRWYRAKRAALWLPFGAGVAGTLLLAFFGSQTPFFAQFQPQRFTIALNLLLILPAAIGFLHALRCLFAGRRPALKLFIGVVLFALLYQPFVRPFLLVYKYPFYRLSCTFPTELLDLLSLLEKHTTMEGRILIEDSEATIEDPAHAYYGGHLTALFPEYLQREYLAAPRPLFPIKHSFASFTRGELFERDVNTFSLEALQRLFDLHNVGWVVSWYPPSIAVFDRFPEYLTRVGIVDETFVVYAVNRTPSFFLKGNGTVSADYNMLTLSGVIAEEGEIIISYHWLEALRVDPPQSLEPVFIGDGPIGFIKVVNPSDSFTITNSYTMHNVQR